MDDYVGVNRANWDQRAPAHAASVGYGLDRFVEDPSFLSEVVSFDRDLLGEVNGLDGVNLQCPRCQSLPRSAPRSGQTG